VPLGSGFKYVLAPGAFPVSVLREMGQHLGEAERTATYWVTVERVTAAREGLDWLLEKKGLKGVNLEDPSVFPRIGPEKDGVDLDLKRMLIREDYVSLNDEGIFYFGAHGRIGTHVEFERDGGYVVTVTAKGKPYEEIWPRMTVTIGQKSSEPVSVSSGEYTSYDFHMDVSAGVRQLLLSYRNSAHGGRRNLFIKAVRIEGRRLGQDPTG
jgi:hypothetical protein